MKNENRLIYLLRHGSIFATDNERRYIGQLDLPLAPIGILQAQQLQQAFAAKEIAAIFCSDLQRSQNTASIIAAGLQKNIISKSELREISMGDWEGKTFQEIAAAFPEEYSRRGADIINYRIAGAESFATAQYRIIAAFTEILAAAAGNIIIVAHAGINRLLLCHLLGMPAQNLFRLQQNYACINIISNYSNQYRVQLLNGNSTSLKP